MEEFFSTILYSWGSDAPAEVTWGLNDLLKYLKTKGLEVEEGIEFLEDPMDPNQASNEKYLIKEITEFLEKKL